MKIMELIDTVAHIIIFFGAWLLYFRMFTSVAPSTKKGKTSMLLLRVVMLSAIGLHLMGVFVPMDWYLNIMSYAVLPLVGLWIHHGHQFHLREQLKKEFPVKRRVIS